MIKNKILWLVAVIFTYYIAMHLTSQQAKIDKAYIINLDKSTHRYARMQDKLESMDLDVPYERFSAIDGRKIKFTNKVTDEVFSGQEILKNKIWLKGDYDAKCSESDTESVSIHNLNQDSYNRRIPGEVGIICSHTKIWQEIVNKGYQNTLIMEDDIRVIPFFNSILTSAMNNAPKDYELLFLHYKTWDQSSEKENLFSAFFNKYIKNFFWKRIDKNIMSVQSYILTNEGAKKLLECAHNYSMKNFLAIDITVTSCINDHKIIAYASKPKFIYHDHEVADISDIETLENKDQNNE